MAAHTKAAARSRQGIGPKGEAKAGKVMREFHLGTLRSGSKRGPEVTEPAQAKAIAMSEARKTARAKPKA